MREGLLIYTLVAWVTFVADVFVFSFYVAKRANRSKVLAAGAAVAAIVVAFLLAWILRREGIMILNFVVAFGAMYVAPFKGRSTFAWSAGAILLGPPLLLVLLCLPDLSPKRFGPPPAKESLAGAFLLPIDDVAMAPRRETVVAGRVERGKIKAGQEVEIVGLRPEPLRCVVKKLAMSKIIVREAMTGDRIGVLLAGTDKGDVRRGMVLSQPGSVTAHAKFRAEVMPLTKEQGGREAGISHGLQAQFHFWSADMAGTVKVPQETQTVSSGGPAILEIELASPVAMERGLGFTILENGQTVGMGTVTELL